jgi:hypothetical protein
MTLSPIPLVQGPPGQAGPKYQYPWKVPGKELEADERLSVNLHKYQLLANAMHGGLRMIQPPYGTLNPITGEVLRDPYYLFRLPGESRYNKQGKDSLKERVKKAAPGSTFNEILEQYKNYLFRQAIDRTTVETLLGKSFMGNVDSKGTPANDWLKTYFVRGIAQGAVFCLVDYPKLEEEYASKEQESAADRQPYLRIIPVTKLYQWEQNFDGTFAMALIKETRDIYYRWKPGEWEKLSRYNKVLDRGKHPIKDKAPLVSFIAQDPPDEGASEDLPTFGVSPIEAVAYLQLRYNQQASLLEDIQEKANFPLLHGNRDPEEVQRTTGQMEKVGPDRLFLFDGDLQWLVPAVESCEEARKHLDHLEERMYKAAGLHMAFKYSVEAHSGKSLEYQQSPIFATIQGWGSRLRFSELRIWNMVAQYMKKDG